MKTLPVLLSFIGLSVLSPVVQAQTLKLEPLVTFGTNSDGSIRPNDFPFLTATNQFQRGMAYNPTTGHLLVVDRSPNSSVNNDVHILDGNTGAYIGKLDNNGIMAGGTSGFLMNQIGITEDGAIYVANLSSTSPEFRLYRWENETAPQMLVFPNPSFPVGDLGNGDTNTTQRRWGDTMSVRGSGLTTQVLLANRGTLAAILTPEDSSMSTFSVRTLTTDVPRGALGYGLSFGAGNTFWGTAGALSNGPLYHLQFDTTAGTATTIRTFASSNFPGTISPLLVVPSSNLLAGITTIPGADVVRLYDISNTNQPVLLDRKSFVTSNNNGNYAGALALGTNGVLYALDADNGIMAFTLTTVSSNPLAPSFYMNPSSHLVVAGNATTLTAIADGDAPITYRWKLGTNYIDGATNSTLTLTNVQATDAGSYTAEATNSQGIATSAAAVLSVVSTPPNSLIVYDPFDYAVGSAIAGQGSWVSSAGVGAITNDNLTVPGLAQSSGNSLTWGTTGGTMRRGIGTNASGSLYFSFAYKIEVLGNPTANTVAAFSPTTNVTTATYTAKVNVRVNGSGYSIGIFKGGGETAGSYATNVFNVGETVFVVGRYTFNDGTGDDTVDLWLNPDPSTFAASNPPPAAVANIFQNTDSTPIQAFVFRQSGSPQRTVADEVRVGLTWADVTPSLVPQPTLAISKSNATSVLISWPAAATGYNLESALSLSAPIPWNPVTNSVIVSGGNNTVTVNASSGNQFFRLRK